MVFNRERFDFLFFHPLWTFLFSSESVRGFRLKLNDTILTSSVGDKPEGSSRAFGVKERLGGKGEVGGWRLAHPLGPLFPVPRLAVPATSFQ